MLSPSYIDGVAEPLLPIYSELQTRIQADIARRIAVTGKAISSAEWQIIKLRQIGMAQAEIQKAIAEALNVSEAEVVGIFRRAGIRSMRPDRVLQKAAIKAGKLSPSVAPLGSSVAFQQVMSANAVRTLNTLKRLTGTIAIDATGQLNKYMDMAQLMVQSGAFTSDQAAQVAVQRFAADEVMTFDYFSNVRTSIEAAVRRALVTGVNQAIAEISLANAAELGTDLVEVTSHADSRPEHAKWQGGVYSISGMHPRYKKLSEETRYGSVTGLCGANCRHSFYAFIEGVSERLPKEHYKEETYEAEQESRYNERMIRMWKRRAATLEAGKQNATAANARVRKWQERQRMHVKAEDLAREYNREQIQ